MEELQIIQNKIYEVRGQKVMLDRDLAELYGVTTGALNQAVKRNIERFEGDDFMFQLTEEERENMSSQFVMTSRSKRPKVALPYAFTEQGVAMLSGVLHSKIAIQVNRAVMRAFVTLRSQVAGNSGVVAELDEIRVRLARLERNVDRIPRASRLAAGIRVGTYSDKALVIFTATKEDRALLRSIGARFNPWLVWQGCRTSGWIYPKSRAERLIDILPQEQEWKDLLRHVAHYKKRRS